MKARSYLRAIVNRMTVIDCAIPHSWTDDGEISFAVAKRTATFGATA